MKWLKSLVMILITFPLLGACGGGSGYEAINNQHDYDHPFELMLSAVETAQDRQDENVEAADPPWEDGKVDREELIDRYDFDHDEDLENKAVVMVIYDDMNPVSEDMEEFLVERLTDSDLQEAENFVPVAVDLNDPHFDDLDSIVPFKKYGDLTVDGQFYTPTVARLRSMNGSAVMDVSAVSKGSTDVSEIQNVLLYSLFN